MVTLILLHAIFDHRYYSRFHPLYQLLSYLQESSEVYTVEPK